MDYMFTLIGTFIGVILFVGTFLASRYKRSPSNKILVVYGKVGEGKTALCIHGGGKLIIPLIQDYGYLSLDPFAVEINLTGALSKKNIRVNVPSTFTVGVSTKPDITQNAAERILGLNEQQIKDQVSDIILGQLRLVIATLTIEEINQDREQFLDLINKNVATELQKIGLEVINVNIRDITDESGYIEAIGQKAAAEAINQAKVEVAIQNKEGAIGEAKATKEKEVSVANEESETVQGRKSAERNQRIAVAGFENEAAIAEAKKSREKEVALAIQIAEQDAEKKDADARRRIKVSDLEAEAIDGENIARAKIAESAAELMKREAEADRISEVAKAKAQTEILAAQKEEEKARLVKQELAQQEVNKLKFEVEADAEAEKIRRIARGNADAIRMKYEAEAAGIQQVLEAKATGYQKLINSAGGDSSLIPTLLLVEQFPEIVKEQVKAIQNLKIDKITVWDTGNSQNGTGKNTTANFLSGMMGSLPQIHELAEQAGIDLPEFLGKVQQRKSDDKEEKNEGSAD
jgi:flotillin